MSVIIAYYVETSNDSWETIQETFVEFEFRSSVANIIDSRLNTFPEQFEKLSFWKNFYSILLNNKEFAVHVQSVNLLLSILNDAGISERESCNKYILCVIYTDHDVEDLTCNFAKLCAENESS